MTTKTVSHNKLAANRANARKSTGPRTPHGKARSARNALRHGLFAEHIVLPDDAENLRELHAIRDRLWADLQPRSFVEEMLIERLAASYWRLRRAYRFEVNAIRDFRAKPPDPLAELARQMGVVADAPHSPAELPPDPDFDKLLRYEAMIDRTLHRLFQQLTQLRRNGLLPSGSLPPPSPDPVPRAAPATVCQEPPGRQPHPSSRILHPSSCYYGTNPPPDCEAQGPAASQASILTRLTKRPPRRAATSRPSPAPKTNPPARQTNPPTPTSNPTVPTTNPPAVGWAPPTTALQGPCRQPPPQTTKPRPPTAKPPATSKPPPLTTKPPPRATKPDVGWAPPTTQPPPTTKPPSPTADRPPPTTKPPPRAGKPPPPTTDTS